MYAMDKDLVFVCCMLLSWNHDFWLSFIQSLSVISSSVISLSVTLHLWLFICDSSSVISSSVPLSFIYGSVHYTENIKGIRTWKMPYGINNNIFHKLQEKNTLAFSNWTLQIKSLMKSAHSGQVQLIYGLSNYKSSPDNSVHFICYSCPVNWNL